MQNKIPQQTVWDEPGNSGSVSGCALTNPLPVCSHLASSWDQDFPLSRLGLGSDQDPPDLSGPWKCWFISEIPEFNQSKRRIVVRNV